MSPTQIDSSNEDTEEEIEQQSKKEKYIEVRMKNWWLDVERK